MYEFPANIDGYTALENLDPSELILMDKTYKERILYRRKILKEHHETVIAMHDESDPRAIAAVKEFYRYIMSTYLPVRYPTVFRLHETAFETGKAYMLENLVFNELYPSEVTELTSPMRALEILYKTVDEDYLILLPDKSDGDDTKDAKYRLVAYETCYPAGFNPRQKLGKLLADIHDPVPGYHEKLEKSMDRHFASIAVGKYVKRVNWSISTNTELFAAFGGLHSSVNETQVEKKIKKGTLDVDSVCYSCFKKPFVLITEIKTNLIEALAVRASNTSSLANFPRYGVWFPYIHIPNQEDQRRRPRRGSRHGY